MPVRYGDAEPNGLALMLGGLVEGNLSAHPERERLLRRSATYGVTAPDAEVSASLRLTPQGVTVRNGIVGRPQIRVEAASESLLGLSGVPLRFGLPDVTTREGRALGGKLLGGEIRVRGMWRHPLRLARLTRLLSVARPPAPGGRGGAGERKGR